MPRTRKHMITVEIEFHDPRGSTEAADELIYWLETFGYTSAKLGFNFISVVKRQKKTKTKNGGLNETKGRA